LYDLAMASESTDRTDSTAGTDSTDGAAFVDLLRQQIRHEFTASQQYIALAVWFDEHDLPQLAGHFYQQSVEERNHAMMMIRWMVDRDLSVPIPGVDEVRNDFGGITEPIALALAQERTVTDQIKALFAAARAEGDFLVDLVDHCGTRRR
jgi:ferritin